MNHTRTTTVTLAVLTPTMTVALAAFGATLSAALVACAGIWGLCAVSLDAARGDRGEREQAALRDHNRRMTTIMSNQSEGNDNGN